MKRPLVCLIVLLAACVGVEDPEPERVEAAFALGEHKRISREACLALGMPRDLCIRLALEDRNTDASDEQEDPPAHAHGASDQSTCAGANLVLDRMVMLGEQYRTSLNALRALTASKRPAEEALVGDMLDVVGRALHTTEDNFAHAGVRNPQHAWYTLQDMCEGTEDSPDLRPGAAAAATDAIEVILRSLESDLSSIGRLEWVGYRSCPQVGERPQISANRCAFTKTPSLSLIRDFLGEAKDWDGIDRQWSPPVMSEAIRDAYLLGTTRDMCEEPALEAAPAAPVDVRGGPARCFKANVICLGPC